MSELKDRLVRFLRWTERYTKTDMVYLASGGFWLVLGQIGSIILSLALAIIFGHFATQDTYGNYKYIVTIGSLLSALSLSGLGIAVTRAAARGDEGSLQQGFALSLRWSLLLVLAGFCASAYYFFLGNPFAGVGIAVAALTLPFINGLSLYDSFLVGIRQFRPKTLYSIGSLAFTTAALAITLLFFSQRAIVLVAVYFASNLLTDVLWYFFTVRKVRNDKTDPEMLTYGFHLSVMGVINVIADKIDSIVIFTLLGPAQLAVYSYAIAIPEQIKNAVKLLTPISMPRFVQRSVTEIKRNIWGRVLQFSIWLAGGIVLYIVISPLLFKYLFPVYIQSIPYSQLYAISIIFTGVPTIVLSVLQAHQRTKSIYIISNGSSILLIIALPILTYFFGITGAIWAQLLYRFGLASTSILELVRAR